MPYRDAAASLWTRSQPNQGRRNEQNRGKRPEYMNYGQCCGLCLDHVGEHLKQGFGRESKSGN